MQTKSRDEADEPNLGIRIEELREAGVRLSADAFQQRYGEAFLLLSSARSRRPATSSSTEVVLLDRDVDADECTADVSVRIVAIRRSEHSLTHLITVGRVPRNDIAIPDISVSRFHAFFKRTPSGGFQLQDAGSTNGTVVNGASVATQQTGAPAGVRAGDNIRFGQVEATFLDAESLLRYVEKFAG
jgi:hypothetical protein